jgi:hypothetical protein
MKRVERAPTLSGKTSPVTPSVVGVRKAPEDGVQAARSGEATADRPWPCNVLNSMTSLGMPISVRLLD